jgi:DNA-damage-inducible protein J
MSRTSNIFARIEPELKEQAESVLSQLGIPMSNAIGLFLRQVVLQRGIPFDMKLPQHKPVALASLSEAEFNAEIEKGFADMTAGRMRPAVDVFADLQRDYGV